MPTPRKNPIRQQSWTIERTDPYAHRLKFEITNKMPVFSVLYLADLHWDNKECDLKYLKNVFDQAKAINAPIILAGDTFCAMQGKWDKRKSWSGLRKEHHGEEYLDLLVDTASKWFSDYASNLALVMRGNHEDSILERHQVDLIQRFVQNLKNNGSPVQAGQYWGYLMQVAKMGMNTTNKCITHIHHGYGGGGEITRGLIDNSRTRSQYLADIFLSGHIHRMNSDVNIITYLNHTGKVRTKKQIHLRAGTFKDEKGGWHARQGRARRPLGGWWVDFKRKWTEEVNGYEMRWTYRETEE